MKKRSKKQNIRGFFDNFRMLRRNGKVVVVFSFIEMNESGG